MLKKNGLVTLVLCSGVMLSGCSLVAKPADVKVQQPTKNYVGMISNKGGKFLMTTEDGQTVEMTSKKVDLGKWVNRLMKVTGEFSGTTLYVDEVELVVTD